jgi:hypothetical protein
MIFVVPSCRAASPVLSHQGTRFPCQKESACMLDNEPVMSEPSQEGVNTHRFIVHPFSPDSH